MARGKVLVVDDDLAVCRCLARLLEAGGLAPLITTDPSRAEALAGEGAELGLVDVFMGGHDGRDVCRSLLGRPGAPRTVLFTGLPEEELARDCFRAGAVGFRLKADGLGRLAEDARFFFSDHAPAAVTRGGGLGRGRSALVIEDDDEQRALVARALAEDGFVPYAASRGRQGLLMAARLAPEAVVLDVRLPDLAVEDALAALKAAPRPPTVLARTGTLEAGRERGLRQLGADGFAVKAVNRLDALAPQLADLLERPAAPGGSARAGRLSLDPADGLLRRDGRPLRGLAPNEARLMALALRRHPGVATWRQVGEALGLAAAVDACPHALTEALKRLRRKLDGTGVGLVTEPGFGLRLVVTLT